MNAYTRRSAAVLLALSLAGSVTACNMSTNEDAEQAVEKASEKAHGGDTATNENGAGEDLSYADMSKEDFAEQAAKAIDDCLKNTTDSSLVQAIDELSDEEKNLLKRVDSVEHYAELSDEEKDQVFETADKIYNMRHYFAGVDEMNTDDRGAFVVGLNFTLDAIWRFTAGKGGMSVTADLEKAEVDEGRTKATFPLGSLDMKMGGVPGNQGEPMTAVVEDGQLRVDGHYLIELGQEGRGGTVTKTHVENGVTTTEEATQRLFEE